MKEKGDSERNLKDEKNLTSDFTKEKGLSVYLWILLLYRTTTVFN
jgi:hypothetical protein